MSLVNKQILLGVSGSIAAYKAADLCSQLGKLGADVHVILTPNAARFVGAVTFRALTQNPVLCDVFEEPHARRIAHIDLAQSADIVLVAPASADLIARAAAGIADDMLTTCLLAVPASTPLLIAPAMNTVMWGHPATAHNVEILKSRGAQIVEPGHGLLACQDVGVGKLADVSEIVRAVTDRLEKSSPFEGLRLIVTAGATREPIDPVRFLSNRSSGKMGYAIAAEAALQGAQVTLISGFATAPPPDNVSIVAIRTAEEMLQACAERFDACDVFISAAAVADYAPVTVAPQKIKKSALISPPDVPPSNDAPDAAEGELLLRLRRTPDVLATLGARKKPGQALVGFAAETENLVSHARSKLSAKRLDLIVANDVSRTDAGFETDTNSVTLLWPNGRSEELPLLSKREVARRILEAVRALLPT